MKDSKLMKVFKDTVLNVEVINDKEFMVDISGIAKSYGKKVADWKNSKRMEETLKILEQGENSTSSAMFKKIKEKGSLERTFIHSKLLISFARFISVEFEIWCDEFIMEYLTKPVAEKDEEIKRLKAEKKLCKITSDGYSSVRGIAQRTKYSEGEIRTLAKDLGLIEAEIRDTVFWKIKDDKNRLVIEDENKTPYFNMERMENLLEQVYG